MYENICQHENKALKHCVFVLKNNVYSPGYIFNCTIFTLPNVDNLTVKNWKSARKFQCRSLENVSKHVFFCLDNNFICSSQMRYVGIETYFNKRRSSAAMFSVAMNQNGSKIELLQTSENVGTIGSEESSSYISKHNFRQKLVSSKLIYSFPEEHFQPKKPTFSFFDIFFRFWVKNFELVLSKLLSTCTEKQNFAVDADKNGKSLEKKVYIVSW